MRRLPCSLLVVPLVLAACSQSDSSVREKDGLFLEGRARVLSVDPGTATVTLDIDGKPVKGYWELEHMTAQGGSVVQQGPFKPPLADYREALVRQQEFPAQEGDTIYFVAMKTGSTLFLRGVRVISR